MVIKKWLLYISFFVIKTCLFSQNKVFNILKFGAIGDGKTMNTKAIQTAIDSCAAQGDGQVIVPKGIFLTGTLILKSNVALHLTEGSILLGSDSRKDYQKMEWYALLLAKDQSNIKITGKGMIDGQGRALAIDVYRMWKAGLLPQNTKKHDRPDELSRPQIIEMTDCRKIHIEGVTIKDAACWVQTYHNCQDLIFRKIKVESTAYWNNDGLDLVDCKNVLVENSSFNTADDAICLKSHDTKSRCENITIKNCTVRSSASAFKMGTASYGGFKNIKVNGLKVYDTYRSAVALECVDGGILEDIYIENIKGKNIGNALFIRLGHRSKYRPVGQVKNIFIKNIKADIPNAKPDRGYEMEGPREEQAPYNVLPVPIVGLDSRYIMNVNLNNIKIKYGGDPNRDSAYIPVDSLRKVPENPHDYPEFSMFGELPSWGFYVRHTEGVSFKNIKIKLRKKDYRPAIVFDDVKDIKMEKVGISEGGFEPKIIYPPNKK